MKKLLFLVFGLLSTVLFAEEVKQARYAVVNHVYGQALSFTETHPVFGDTLWDMPDSSAVLFKDYDASELVLHSFTVGDKPCQIDGFDDGRYVVEPIPTWSKRIPLLKVKERSGVCYVTVEK